MAKDTTKQFSSFKEFYPYYLKEHSNPRCRAMHYIGSTLVLALLAYAFITQQWLWLVAIPVVGYGFAWLGHFLFEHNRPATFKHPWYSLLADWVMYAEFLKRSLSGTKDQSGSR
ncbi:DUF962 domain-containing protein [Pseudidiomarina sp. 1ASP75-14]|uniref:DUF962 domain-containing protein n=1 Tax=Pseudidiomarina terrestris TaxID=2820060 RepID=UPI00265702DF|nr:DUF962 domain-containing protein [Pseudidiomarina sp. 1ASP75-14]MDN7137679.1 DUF962 domain-containing protein [Pseudidiomarina sp. 1ASP75-14]